MEKDADTCSAEPSFKPRNYSVESLLAEGGVGTIHRAVDLNIERLVAIKVLRDDKLQSRQEVARFIREAKINGQLEHPNIVPVYELGRDEHNKPYYTMRLVQGVTLEDILDGIRRGDARTLEEFPLAGLLTIFEKVCDAVAFAHSRGIVHRDLKPSNVMVGEYGEVLVMDWGMAKVLKREPASPVSPTPVTVPSGAGGGAWDGNLTVGYIMGTPTFMSPEQVENRPLDARCDIYTLGGILYNILTLHPPHEEKEMSEMLEAIRSGVIRSPLVYNPPSARRLRTSERVRSRGVIGWGLSHCPEGRIPEALSLIAMKALALDPKDRYQTARELRKDIQAYQGGFITSAETRSPYKFLKLLIRRRRTEFELIGASILIMLILTVTYVVGLVSSERAKGMALQGQLKAEEERRLLELRTAAERQRNWHLVFREDFSNTNVLSRWDIHGQWTVKNRKLRLEGPDNQCMRFKTPVPGDVRLVFDCLKDGEELSDLSCFVGALKTSPMVSAYAGGYLFQYGAYWNRRNRLRSPQAILVNERAAPLVRGKTYHVDAQKMGNRLVLKIDGQTIFDVRDEGAMYGAENAFVGFYNWQVPTVYSGIAIYRRDAALTADLLEVAEDCLACEQYVTAQDLFKKVMESSHDPARSAQAEKGYNRAAQLLRLIADYPSIKARLLRIWPQADISRVHSGIVMDISGLGVRDLTPLRGLMISELRCDFNRIESLEPLKGMELHVLSCNGNRIASLEPLKGMPLVKLSCSDNRIRDLEPLRGMKLRGLSCGDNPISSLEPLRRSMLSELEIRRLHLTSLEVLKEMELIDLDFSDNQVSSLEPLRGMILSHLLFSSNQVRDLEPLRGMDYNQLHCSDNQITSLEPLKGGKPWYIACQGNPVSTLSSVIQNMPLDLDFDLSSLSPTDRAVFEAHSGRSEYDLPLRRAQIRACAQNRQVSRLKTFASQFEGHHYVVVPMDLTWEDARKMSEELGGHLVTISSRQENDFLAAQFQRERESWIGLVLEGKGRRWVTGEPVSFQNFKKDYDTWVHASLQSNGNWNLWNAPSMLSAFCVEWDE
jgi:serine/threonine protein kinase